MKKIIFVLLFILSSRNIYTWEDLYIRNYNNTNVEITFQIVSIPFEGLNNCSLWGNNRCGEILNGYQHRRFIVDNSHIDYPLIYAHDIKYNNELRLFSCFYESPPSGLIPCWGFAKYLITIKNLDDPNEPTYHFYWNSLDSKMGVDNNPPSYHTDWQIKYIWNSNRELRHIEIWTDNILRDQVAQNEQYKELKLWKLFYNREEPWAKDFYAKTTPFPIHPDPLVNINIDNYYFRNLILGTTVTLSGVYPNTGEQDRYGYNTVINFQNNNYYDNPPIPVGYNEPGNTYVTPAWFYMDPESNAVFGMRITAAAGDKMIIKNNKKLWISGDKFFRGGDTLIFSNNSFLEKEPNTCINSCFLGCFIDSGAATTWASNSYQRAFQYSEICYMGQQHTVNNGGFIVIDGGAFLKLGNNTTLTFDGPNTYLKLDPTSNVIAGTNATLKFTNGAYLLANGAIFNKFDNTNFWSGIVLDNAGEQTSIQNCTFNNATTSITIRNDAQSAPLLKKIQNNVFNITPNNGIGIYAKNIFNITCDGNTFNINSSMGGFGVKVQNYMDAQSPFGGGSATYNLNFTNNYFNYGSMQMFLGCYTGQLPSFYVYNNHFNNALSWCFAGRSITGDIKQNYFNSSCSSYGANYGFGLWQSDARVYNNTFNSNMSNMYLNSGFPVMAPQADGNGDFVWVGGTNILQAQTGNNIFMNYGNPFTDHGQNKFTISNNSYYHLYGQLPNTITDFYYTRDNCWYGFGSLPKTFLYNYDVNEQLRVIPTYTSGSTFNCNQGLNVIGQQLIDKGNGISDTVFITSMTQGDSISTDAALYGESTDNINASNYFEAITDLKMLIDNYSSSPYLYTSLYDLYHCYEMLDTSGNQNTRDIMFSNLKNYLNDKIQLYYNDPQFVDIAYNLTLSCDTKMQNYNSAASGYEFIALYHPNEEIQLFASIDYTYIEELLNGGGGKSNTAKSFNLKKFLDKKPVNKIVKESYEKVTENNLLQANSITQKYSRTDKNELIERAKNNITTSIGLAKEEKERRRAEDLRILLGLNRISLSKEDNITPLNFSLSQNYPNPFNPVTKIKYELPKNINVTIKVYDLLGREVVTLINNEFKQAGIYEIEWNGSNYASGVYFYRIEAGSFVNTKKMVLLK